ncbi:putative toxin-antitoxin system toxin component, PIN family [Chitinophaga rupis]|uniref:Putative toxin-antitoxin system toxin component, PIN family n=1 Tax=Chitinophaga rupis TaxID=573321 RepID=A0A1H7HWF3_9BACT|nr:putative toxin-antitoxin system toxin component, PIN family [Chitinophaga rupis]SEK53902.1 putative toxin-antitoxin system toxin component, PIN family [Chitinophaga rupis]
MRAVLDCNILVMCLTSRSPYHIVYKALIAGKFDLIITEDILFEYAEIIQQKYGLSTAAAFLSLLTELPNVHSQFVYYKWNLIEADPDDNKYVDSAIAGQAEYLVTEDKHFAALKQITFPQVNTLSINDFVKMLQEL